VKTESRSLLHFSDISQYPNAYESKKVEAHWYEWWSANNYFGTAADRKQRFSMILPPPNVTGHLHLGHALTVSIQDAIVRW
jgi:valyl-tRNA synthetase